MGMAGRMGFDRKTVKNLKVLRVDRERNLLLVKGAVPGSPSELLVIVNPKGQKQASK
jgi:large subunit ribosomal protein L3